MTDATGIVVDVASALSVGARSRQEDALATAFAQGSDFGFAVLSDGMGGHAAGDLASRIIVTEIFAELTLRSSASDFSQAEIPGLLRDAVNVANRCIRAHIDSDGSTAGMGGTVISTVVVDNQLHWISIGDSPLYLFRNGNLVRLNEDHSMAPQIDLMASQGLIDADEAKDHPQRNCLTSALIGEDIPQIDCPDEPFELLDGDVVLVASDGLDFLPEGQIVSILKRSHRQKSDRITNELLAGVAGVNDPQQDNISLVVIKACESGMASQMPYVSPVAMLKACVRAVAPARQTARG